MLCFFEENLITINKRNTEFKIQQGDVVLDLMCGTGTLNTEVTIIGINSICIEKSSIEIGSTTAKGGFANEKAICNKFNNWKTDKEAQIWLQIMGYNLKEIDSVEAVQIPARMRKEDVEKLGLKETFEELMKFKKTDA